MFKAIWAFLRSKKRVFLRALYEFTFPTICGIAWGIVARTRGAEGYAAISLGAGAFFFIFAMQGQILRMNRNVRDDDDREDFRASLADLKAGMNELREQRAQQPIAPPPVAGVAHAQPFIQQAYHALQHGLFYSAALTASVGFEQALREAGTNMKLSPRQAAHAIARELAYIVKDKKLEQRLLTLNRLRNSLVHAEPQTTDLNEESASELISGFDEGIRLLEKFNVPYYGSTSSGTTY